MGVDYAPRLHEHAPCDGNGPRKERTVESNGNASAEKVAIVTASGSGMGAACARALAGRGHAVALMSTSGKAEALAKELGGLGLTGSVTEEADLEVLVGEALEGYGRIDGVVNSTGHAASGDVLVLTDGQWHEALDLVVLNVVRIARLVTPAMRRRAGGARAVRAPRRAPRPPCNAGGGAAGGRRHRQRLHLFGLRALPRLPPLLL